MQAILNTPTQEIKIDNPLALTAVVHPHLAILACPQSMIVIYNGGRWDYHWGDAVELLTKTVAQRYREANIDSRIEFLKSLGATEWADGTFFIDPRKPANANP
jgi:hypothetical protein